MSEDGKQPKTEGNQIEKARSNQKPKVNEHTPNFFGLLEDKGFTMHDELAVPQNKRGLIEKTLDFAEDVVDAVADGFNKTTQEEEVVENHKEDKTSVASKIHVPMTQY